MSLELKDVYRIAELSELSISETEAQNMRQELNDIMKMIDKIQSVDTHGIEPMAHPHDGFQRLRPDVVTQGNDREANMRNAPEESQGYFLVPQVIE